jgi:hypothetical protein
MALAIKLFVVVVAGGGEAAGGGQPGQDDMLVPSTRRPKSRPRSRARSQSGGCSAVRAGVHWVVWWNEGLRLM